MPGTKEKDEMNVKGRIDHTGQTEHAEACQKAAKLLGEYYQYQANCYRIDSEEREAMALIATAGQLRHACKMALQHYEPGITSSDVATIRILREAIAKADGVKL